MFVATLRWRLLLTGLMILSIACDRHRPAAPQTASATSASVATMPAAIEFNRVPRRTELGQSEVRMPIELITAMPAIVFKAGDATQRRLLLDTGANSVVLTPQFAASAGLTTRPSDRVSSDVTGRRAGILTTHLPSITLGAARFEDFDADVQTLFAGMDALLGWPMFRDLLVRIEYANRTIVFTRGSLPPPDGKEVLPLRLEDDRLMIQANVDGHDLWLQLDTGWGNGSNVELTTAQLKELPWASPAVSTMAVNAAGGSAAEKLGRLRGDLVVGRYRIVQPIVGTTAADWVGILAAQTLQNFVVTLDVKNLRVRLERPGDEPIRCPPIDVAGFSCDLTSNPLKVVEVLPGSQAERAGLRVGDLLLKIDGLPALQGLFANSSNSYTIELQRGNDRLTLNLPLTRLVP